MLYCVLPKNLCFLCSQFSITTASLSMWSGEAAFLKTSYLVQPLQLTRLKKCFKSLQKNKLRTKNEYWFVMFVQYEGAAFKYGKGPSTWDTYTHKHPGLSLSLSMVFILNFTYNYLSQCCLFVKFREDCWSQKWRRSCWWVSSL